LQQVLLMWFRLCWTNREIDYDPLGPMLPIRYATTAAFALSRLIHQKVLRKTLRPYVNNTHSLQVVNELMMQMRKREVCLR
jgi:hypothetical protein